MKVLILVSCIVATARAAYYPGPHGPVGYQGPQHIPVIQNGVPVEPPEVQHAKAAHYSALAEASSRPGYHPEEPKADPNYDDGQYREDPNAYGPGPGPAHYSAPAPIHYSAPAPAHYAAPAPVHYAQAAPAHYAPAPAPSAHGSYGKSVPHAYQTSHIVPAVNHDGRPLDTPEVEQAKAHHFAAFSEALARAPKGPAGPVYQSHGPAYQGHYRRRRGLYAPHYPQHIPVIGPHGVPVEPAAVQHARAAHLAAYAAQSHGHGDGYDYHQSHAPIYGHPESHDYHFYGVDHKGRPLDTPTVAHAKAAHAAAFHEAAARNAVGPHGHGYAANYGYVHAAPAETPEVQHAKALHFAAHAAARGHHY